ncbi:hypothetical protein GCM10008961_23260 [Deinococcus knuensis]|uniref:Uncharacterized protein n=1 Tax=Deinococcus knuensis TaxID=1837380 RepID=A0ABQ2SIG1_9DEIO|nr:hypothetical protein GCM10008961_23260 [Deinococcus knuensis]
MVMGGAAWKLRTGVSDRNGMTSNDTAGAVGVGAAGVGAAGGGVTGAGVAAGAVTGAAARVAAGAQADRTAPSSAAQVRERPFRE